MLQSITGRTWQLKEIPNGHITHIMHQHEISELQARLVASREPDLDKVGHFLDPKIKHLMKDPYLLLDMDKAVKRTLKAIEDNEKICIYGDYDVDGATSSALLRRVFESYGIEVEVYIPDRMKDGYGLSERALKQIKSNGVSLVITVDSGSMAHEAIDAGNDMGLDIIVIDHHLTAEHLPNAVAIINPNRLDETTEYKYLAAVGVAFLFAVVVDREMKLLAKKNDIIPLPVLDSPLEEQELKERKPTLSRCAPQQPKFDNVGIKNGNGINLMDLMDIVALGTVCDVMPLVGLNRAFVKQGLKVLSARQNIGLKALADIAKINMRPTCYHLGFILGPRINAGGRVGESYLGSKLLSTACEIEAMEIAAKLEEFNNERKRVELDIVEEAKILAAFQADRNLILVSGKWHPGVIGVVAGKLKEIYSKPVAVVSIIDGICKASCRSVKGVDFGSALAEAKLQNLVIVGGGHAMAAGFTTEETKLEALNEFLNERFGANKDAIADSKMAYYELELTSSAVSESLHDEIHVLAPFGQGNPEPIIKIDGLFVLKAYIVGEKHISCLLAGDRSAYKGQALKGICFNAVGTPLEKYLMSEIPHVLSVIGTIQIQHYNGKTYPQIVISDIII